MVNSQFRLPGVGLAQALDDGQGVVEEMRMDLGQHDGCPAFLQFQFLLAEFAGLFHLDADVDAQGRNRGGDI